jgi:hypothetical protein
MSGNSGATLHKFLCIYKNQTNPQVQCTCIYLYSESNNTEELFDKVIDGHFEFNSPFWDDISDSATDLITHMLEVNPGQEFEKKYQNQKNIAWCYLNQSY